MLRENTHPILNSSVVNPFPSQGEKSKGAMTAQGRQVNVLWKSFQMVMAKFRKGTD